MNNRRSLTVAEREAIYDGKLGGERLVDLAQECQCSLSTAMHKFVPGLSDPS